jgi:hypothetical protein
MKERTFVRSSFGTRINAVAKTYGVRPSNVLGLSPLDGRSLLYDIAFMRSFIEQRDMDRNTLQGEIKRKRSKWNQNVVKEAEEQTRHTVVHTTIGSVKLT